MSRPDIPLALLHALASLLEPLAHGYRRIPVMQIGNNIYCDTIQLFNNVKDQMPWGEIEEEQKSSPLHAVFGNPTFLADRSRLSGGRTINIQAIRQAQPFLLD
ncbi:hypothetical protein BGX28_007959 [Mortierella sp. GBA30]|nr:hypothetical protein BGX28_007959 [Mortierella sp. GBA30]